MKLSDIKKYNFLGTHIDCLTYNYLLEKVDHWLGNKQSRSHHIAVLNAYCVTLAFKHSDLRRIYNQADIAGPDGMPFVYWMRLFLRRPCDRLDGPGVLIKLIERAKYKGYTFYLYGGHPEVVQKMKENLLARYSYLKIVGYHSPPFRKLTDEEDMLICEEINRLKPDVLCVGLGTPKQDYWIDEHIEKIRGAVLISSGALFDFLGGRIKRAPRFVSILCFEWLYRLFSKDFKRLWYRYTILNIVFLWNFILQLCGIIKFKTQYESRPES